MIRADQLCKVFQAARGKTIEAVRDASFCVGPGEIYGLLGPNGAGKTTLLRMMATILAPTSGHCYVGDLRTDTDPEEARRRIGFLSGNTRLYGRLTPPEILRYFGRLYGMSSRAIRDRTDELSGLLGMEEFLGRRCETLSTGQTQKVSIARVILHDPPTLILDEPTLGLDIMTARTILQFILAARQRGRSIIFSTHYMTEAELLCDRIGLIHRGTIRAEGTLGELCRLSGASNLVEAFLRIVEPGAAAEPAS